LRTHSSYQEVFFRSNLIFSYYRNAAPLVEEEKIKALFTESILKKYNSKKVRKSVLLRTGLFLCE
ncbi:hypothetical protein OCO53_27075, partial [Peribacillus frigoritolerans]|uniref:hypothetical protein n=1 Tax=Peribacillus frigoritolerans TaxID=450367 RepID=UPI0021D200F9